MSNHNFQKDLTKGSVFLRLIAFAFPFFLTNLVQSTYSVVDLVILGRFAGDVSLSGVNTSSQLMVILTNLAAGISAGGAIMVGQFYGAGQKKKIDNAISTLMITLFVMSIALSAVLLGLTRPMLDLLRVPQEAFEEARVYMVISLAGLVFIFAFNALSSVMRGLGDSRTPLAFVSIAGVVNIALDFLFVAAFGMGAKGSAIATIAAQMVSVISCMVYLKVKDFQFDFKPSSYHWDGKMFLTLLKVGFPTGIQYVCTNLSFLILIAMINSVGGVAAGAASGVVNKFNTFAILPCTAVSSSVSSMISQNMGAARMDRVKKTVRYGLGVCLASCITVFFVAFFLPGPIFRLFGVGEEAYKIGIPYMRAVSWEYLVFAFLILYNAVFIGTGNAWMSLVTNVLGAFIIRIPAAYFLGMRLDLGVTGIGYAVPIATLGGSVIAGIFYFSGKWKKSQVASGAGNHGMKAAKN